MKKKKKIEICKIQYWIEIPYYVITIDWAVLWNFCECCWRWNEYQFATEEQAREFLDNIYQKKNAKA